MLATRTLANARQLCHIRIYGLSLMRDCGAPGSAAWSLSAGCIMTAAATASAEISYDTAGQVLDPPDQWWRSPLRPIGSSPAQDASFTLEVCRPAAPSASALSAHHITGTTTTPSTAMQHRGCGEAEGCRLACPSASNILCLLHHILRPCTTSGRE